MPRRDAFRSSTFPGRAMRLIADLRLAGRRYETGWLSLLRRLVHLRRHCGFGPREALREGLLDPRLPASALPATIAKRSLFGLLARVNPARLDGLTEDKAVFYAYCGAVGLPTPRLFGVAARPVGYAAGGRPLRTDADWAGFAAGLPDEFVVKPSRGAYGRGVELFRRQAGGFVGSASGWHALEDVRSAFFTDERYASFVIQERLQAHPDLVRLSGTAGVQTVRLWTEVDDSGDCQIVFAAFRVIGGDRVTDNFVHGNTGNLFCCVDRADGTLDSALGMDPGGFGWTRVTHHPRTGHGFEGFRLPDWGAACALAQRAALLFLPMRVIAWDVALTAEGPHLVEANRRFDPVNAAVVYQERPSAYEDVAALYDRLRRAPRPDRGW
jgi:hypothetical protein